MSANLTKRDLLAALMSVAGAAALPTPTAAWTDHPATMTDEEMRREILRRMDFLPPDARARFIAFLEWLADDGRPETDPRRADAAWLAWQAQNARGLEGA